MSALLLCAPLALGTEAPNFTETTVWSFGAGADGRSPGAALIFVRGMLYGTTFYGGTHGGGTVFSLDPSTGIEKVVYSFCTQERCADGSTVQAGLLALKGTLYGTTYSGGASGHGTIFSISPKTGVETVLHAFQGGADGGAPVAGLAAVNGVLYGTTFGGAYETQETLFSLDPRTQVETVLHTFCQQQACADGAGPVAALINVKGLLYGTTSVGGPAWVNCDDGEYCGGVLFSFDPETGTDTPLHAFGLGSDGSLPLAPVTDVNGILYGTTNLGGYPNKALCYGQLGVTSCGVVFSFDPRSGREKVVHRFCGHKDCSDGANPSSGLIAVNGRLYGTTSAGGLSNCDGHGCGTVFAIDPKTGRAETVYRFCSQPDCADGATPEAGLLDLDGTLYGTTFSGGSYGSGTIFALKTTRTR